MKDKRGNWRGKCLNCTDCEEYELGTADVNPCGYCGCPPGAHLRSVNENPTTTSTSDSARSDAFDKVCYKNMYSFFILQASLFCKLYMCWPMQARQPTLQESKFEHTFMVITVL